MSKKPPWYISQDMVSDEHPTIFFERMAAKWKCQKCNIERNLPRLSGDNYVCNEPSFEKIRQFGLDLDDPVTLTKENWNNEWDDEMKRGFADSDKFQCQGTLVRTS